MENFNNCHGDTSKVVVWHNIRLFLMLGPSKMSIPKPAKPEYAVSTVLFFFSFFGGGGGGGVFIPIRSWVSSWQNYDYELF